MEKTAEKTVFLRIFKKSDGEKAYLLEREDFYELREGEEESFWKNASIVSEAGMKNSKLSLLGKLSREGVSLAPEATRVWNEIPYMSQYVEEVPLSLTMDEAIREAGHEKALKDLKIPKGLKVPERIPESAFKDLYKWMTAGSESYEKGTGSLVDSEEWGVPTGTTTTAVSPSGETLGGDILGTAGDPLLKKDWISYPSATVTATRLSESSVAIEPTYADSFLPHLVRAKDEGVRRDIESDTIIIDRGVAVSQGLIREEDGKKKHADVIMGLKVRYAKEGILPMDSAFVIFKDKKADEKKAEAAAKAEKSDKDAIKDDCRALGTINKEDLKDMSIDELFTLEENLTNALMIIAHTRKERYDACDSASDEFAVKLGAAFAEASLAEAAAAAEAKHEKEEKKTKKSKKEDKEKISEPAPYDLLGSVKIDPALWKEALSSGVEDTTDAIKKSVGDDSKEKESERSRAIKRGSVFIPRSKIINEADVPKELIAASDRIELKFKDVAGIDEIFRYDESKGEVIWGEEWLVKVRVYHEDDLDECILRIAMGDVNVHKAIKLICEQRGLVTAKTTLHTNSSVQEMLRITKVFSPATGKIMMGVEVEDTLPW